MRKRHRAAAKARREANNRKREWSNYVTTQFKNFTSIEDEADPKLNAEQLGKFLQKMAEDDGHGRLTDAEVKSAVDFIMRAADASGDGAIDEFELQQAVSAWKNWSHSATMLGDLVTKLLKEFDTDMSGSLNRTQFKLLLKKLNDGVDVEEEEVNKIINEADKRGNGAIDMEEVYPALALWYQIPDQDSGGAAGGNLVVVKPTGCHLKGCGCIMM